MDDIKPFVEVNAASVSVCSCGCTVDGEQGDCDSTHVSIGKVARWQASATQPEMSERDAAAPARRPAMVADESVEMLKPNRMTLPIGVPTAFVAPTRLRVRRLSATRRRAMLPMAEQPTGEQKVLARHDRVARRSMFPMLCKSGAPCRVHGHVA